MVVLTWLCMQGTSENNHLESMVHYQSKFDATNLALKSQEYIRF